LLSGGFRQRSTWSVPLTAVAAVSTAVYQLAFFGGTYLTGVAVGTVVGIGSAPVWSGLLGWWFDGERPTPRWLTATGVGIGGVVLIGLSGNDTMIVNPLGILLAVGAGLAYSIFTLVNKRLLADHSADEVMAVTFVLGALLLSPMLIIADTSWIPTRGGLVVVLHLGLIATGLSYAFFGRGLRTVTVATVGTLTLAEPLTAALLGLFVVGETLTLGGTVGVVLVFGGLGLMALPERKTAR
jgi:DME family drug/metabolite transporter